MLILPSSPNLLQEPSSVHIQPKNRTGTSELAHKLTISDTRHTENTADKGCFQNKVLYYLHITQPQARQAVVFNTAQNSRDQSLGQISVNRAPLTHKSTPC